MLTRRELLRRTLGGLAVATVPLAFPPLPVRAAPPPPPPVPRAPRIWLYFNGERVAEAQCMTVSVTREVVPLYGFADPWPKAFVKGKRGIAGTLVLTNFDQHRIPRGFYADELAPLEVRWHDPDRGTLIRLEGVQFVNEGWSYTEAAPGSERAFTYVAQELTVLQQGEAQPVYEGQFVRPHLLTTGGERPLRLAA